MKNFFRIIFVISVLIIASTPLKANALNVGIINFEDVVKNSTVMDDIQKKMTKKQDSFQKDIDKKQSDLEAEGKKLDAKKGILSQEAFKTEQSKFEQKVNHLRSDVDKKQNMLKKASLDAMSKVNDKINEILIAIAKEKDLDIVLPASETLYYKDTMDISSEVLKRLNSSLTKVDIKFE